MADSIVEIVNTTVTEADFVGGYDLVTTDANTSYVIKDVNIENAYLTSVPATINNTVIGDFSASLAGSEIMGVSSTLNITTANYPLAYENFSIEQAGYVSANNLYFNLEDSTIDSVSAASSSETLVISLSAWQALSTSVRRSTFKVGDAYYQTEEGSNTDQRVYYWPTESSARQTLQDSSYDRNVFVREHNAVYYFSGTTLYKHTPSTGAVVVKVNALDASWSSYGRLVYCNNYLFYIASSGFSSSVAAMNLTTFAQIRFSAMPVAAFADEFQLCVSYDIATDKFSIFRKDQSWNVTNNYIRKTTVDQTKTTLDALTANSNNYYTATGTVQKTTASFEAIMQGDFNYGSTAYTTTFLFGSATKGNVFYYCSYDGQTNSDIKIIECDFDAQSVKVKTNTNYTRNTLGGPNVDFQSFVPSAATIAATTYSPSPDFKIRLTGVKSVA